MVRMNKIKVIAIISAVAFSLMGCASDKVSKDAQEVSSSNTTTEAPETENTILDTSGIDETLMTDKQLEEKDDAPTNNGILDLTVLSSTIVYSEVYNMMMAPENYEGTIVKMYGTCNVYTDPNTGKVYYSCIVQDATQCCSQGIEFSLDEDEYTKDDYPAAGEEITVTGEFATYFEGQNRYLTLLDSKLE